MNPDLYRRIRLYMDEMDKASYDWSFAVDSLTGPPWVSKSEVAEQHIKKEKEKAMSYTIEKEITGALVYAEEPCASEFNRFVKRFGFYEEVDEEDVQWMVDNGKEEWLGWLEEHGFISRGKQEKKEHVSFSRRPNRSEGFAIGMSEDDASCLQLYHEGEPIPGAHLFHMRIAEDGALEISRCGSVHWDSEQNPNLLIDEDSGSRIVIRIDN